MTQTACALQQKPACFAGTVKPKAVLFDWDDTIVDNWDTAFAALNAALTHMGVEPWSAEEARRRSGPSAKDLFSGLFGDRWVEADKVYYDTFMSLVLKNIKIHDYCEDILKKLKENGVFLGVVSNKRSALLQEEVTHVGYRPYFGAVLGAGDAAADKPDPAPILMALKQGDVTPGPDVWYVGDSHTDMMAALRAGCSAMLIETKTPPEDLLKDFPPTYRFRSHSDIMECLNHHFS